MSSERNNADDCHISRSIHDCKKDLFLVQGIEPNRGTTYDTDGVDDDSLLSKIEMVLGNCSDHVETPRHQSIKENFEQVIQYKSSDTKKTVKFAVTDTVITVDTQRDIDMEAYDALRQRILSRSRVPTPSLVATRAYKHCRAGTPFPAKTETYLPYDSDDDEDVMSDNKSIECILDSDDGDDDNGMFRNGKNMGRKFVSSRSEPTMEDDFYINSSTDEEMNERSEKLIVDMFHKMKSSPKVKKDMGSFQLDPTIESENTYNTMCMNGNASHDEGDFVHQPQNIFSTEPLETDTDHYSPNSLGSPIGGDLGDTLAEISDTEVELAFTRSVSDTNLDEAQTKSNEQHAETLTAVTTKEMTEPTRCIECVTNTELLYNTTSKPTEVTEHRHKKKKKKKSKKNQSEKKKERKDKNRKHETINESTGGQFFTGPVLPNIERRTESQDKVHEKPGKLTTFSSTSHKRDSARETNDELRVIGKSSIAKSIEKDAQILNKLIHKINEESEVKFEPFEQEEEEPTAIKMSKTRSLTVAKFRAQFNRNCTLLPNIGETTVSEEFGCVVSVDEHKISAKSSGKSKPSVEFINKMEFMRQKCLQEYIQQMEDTKKIAGSLYEQHGNHHHDNVGIERCHGSHELNTAPLSDPYADIKPEYLTFFGPKPPKRTKPNYTRHGRKYKQASQKDQEVLRQKIEQQELYAPHAPVEKRENIRKSAGKTRMLQ